jgi:hypothetical protein
MTDELSLSLSHPPAPHAERISLWRLAFGVAAGPAAWFIQVCVGEALASAPCFPDGQRYLTPHANLAWTWPALIALLALCVLLAFAGFVLSWQAYRLTRAEVAGAPEELMDEGVGRTRFMAFWGVLYGAGFCLITLATLVAYLALPRCAG